MEFIHPDYELAKQIETLVDPLSQKGIMIQVTVEDILNRFETWFVALDECQKLSGFFCLRRPNPDFTEIGSVLSVTGQGAALIKKFETLRSTPYGCAITKNNPDFFIKHTQGRVWAEFPDWYRKTTDDKNFVGWN